MGAAPFMLESAEEAMLLRAAASSLATDRDAACSRLFEAYRARVLVLCFHIIRNQADAEDALQDTFASVFRALEGFRGEARLSTWIYRIALREALRHKARQSRRLEDPVDIDTIAAGDPADPAMAREQREHLSVALGRLSADHRTVLALFAVDGLSHREIAEVLGVPVGTIWSRIHLARKRLVAELDAHANRPSGN